MNKIIKASTVIAMALCLTACGSSAESSETTAQTTVTTTQDTAGPSGYTYELSGTTVYIGADMSILLDSLGDADSYFEAESCAGQGKDKTYTYGSVVITTTPADEADIVSTIELKDDTVSTDEGISIGNSKDEVTEAYGDATTTSDTALIYEKDSCSLSFILDGDVVTDIIYNTVSQ